MHGRRRAHRYGYGFPRLKTAASAVIADLANIKSVQLPGAFHNTRTPSALAIGAMFVFAGVMGFAIPDYTRHEAVAQVGDPRLQSTEDTPRPIPQYLSGGLLTAGLVLVGISLYQKR